MDITKKLWGKSPEGKDIFLFTIKNSSGAYVELSPVGAGIVGIGVPDREGKIENVVLSYAKGEDYFADGPCAGKIPGRYANRIAKGKFTLDGKEYTLPVNNGPNHLHGGPDGFQNKLWESRIEGEAVEFMYFSEDGEAGYPGNLKVVAHYEWSEENELKLTLTAETDAPTVINLTNHVYFNLRGSGSCLDHILRLNASEFLPTDETLIPTGEVAPVAGTPMDFVIPARDMTTATSLTGRSLVSSARPRSFMRTSPDAVSMYILPSRLSRYIQETGFPAAPKAGMVKSTKTMMLLP